MNTAGVRRIPIENDKGMLTGIATVDDLLSEARNDLIRLISREIGQEQRRR